MLMYPKIKICGIKTKDEIEIINKYPVNYIGFIFAKSKRQVKKEDVVELRKLLREDIKAVGVFVNESVETIEEIVNTCNLDLIQLHGEETNELCKQLEIPTWKSIAIKDGKSIEEIEAYKDVEGILLDTYHKGEKGGTGKTFNWDIVKHIPKSKFTILAGGLNPDNVLKAIEEVNPQVLDVNSGVETDLFKDENKIRKLFDNLKGGNISE